MVTLSGGRGSVGSVAANGQPGSRGTPSPADPALDAPRPSGLPRVPGVEMTPGLGGTRYVSRRLSIYSNGISIYVCCRVPQEPVTCDMLTLDAFDPINNPGGFS